MVTNEYLSKHFTVEEFEYSLLAPQKNIKNKMDLGQRKNAEKLCVELLEPIRNYYNMHISISSGFRSLNLNKAVGGSITSEHCNGNAVDFTVKNISTKQLFNDILTGKIKLLDTYDQLIYEYDGKWIHLGRRDKPRHQSFKTVLKQKQLIYVTQNTPIR